jgi:thiol-disulfide isomerase/thioredoxin
MNFLTEEENFQLGTKIQSLYFYASWMPYHKKMLVMIGKMEEKYPQIEFTAIDTDHFKGLCKRFSINSIPTVLIMKDGSEAKRISGMVLTSAFRSAFVDICTSES